jgi:hypothetical protein
VSILIAPSTQFILDFHHGLLGGEVQDNAFACPYPFRVWAAVVHAGGHTPNGIKR